MNTLTTDQFKKYSKKSIPQLLKLAVEIFNKYIRQRDSNDGYFQCISCQEYKPIGQMNAGHYMSAGHHGPVRFDEDNCHGQCIHCNSHLHGNLSRYRENLIKKIGEDRVKYLEAIARTKHKWNKESLIFIVETYKEKAKYGW